MRSCLHIIAAILFLFGLRPAFAQPNTPIVPYLDAGYRYLQVGIGGLPGFQSPAFPDTAFATGAGGFGSPGNCALNTPQFIHTLWTPNSDILIRKRILLPAGTRHLRIGVAIDNDIQVFFNGVDVSGGMRTREGCAFRGAFTFAVPDSLLQAGENLLAARGRDRGVMAYLDVEVVADLPRTFIVGTTADSGPGSLREAIFSANLYPERDSILFNLPGGAPHTISLLSPLPAITSPVVIDGTFQPGYTGSPLVGIDGSGFGLATLDSPPGLQVLAGGSVIRGLRISGFPGDGILLTTEGGNIVGANVIGDSGNGTGGNGGAGVRIDSPSSDNRIGGAAETDANLIAGNGRDGVVVAGGSRNLIQGNTIVLNGGNGVSVPGGISTSTSISGNRMKENALLGIDVGADGLTPPDLVLSFAAFDLKAVGGTLNGAPFSTYTLEFFDNETPDPSGFGEGNVPLGGGSVTTDSAGTARFYLGVPGPMNSGRFVTATLTDAAGSTSEFSGAMQSIAKVKIYGDHYVVNTTFSGIPLHWPNGAAAYQISASVPEDYRDAIQRGFASWHNLPDLTYAFGGVTPDGVWGGEADGRNLVSWITEGWEDLTGLDPSAVAGTRVRYNASNGLMTDVDMAFDAQHFSWGESSGAEGTIMDVENVTAHEAGHVSGLGDIYDPGDPGHVSAMNDGNAFVTMYGLIAFDEISKRSLEQPDSSGISYIYSVVPPGGIDLVLVFDPSAGYAVTQGAFERSRYSALELLPKMRPGDRLGIVVMPGAVALPLTPMGDSTGRTLARNALEGILPGGPSAIGAGLQTAQGLSGLGSSGSSAPAFLLFSAGEEDASPTALSVLGPILGGGTRIFTLGFPGSYGQALANTLADTTGGGYFLATDSTISQAVNEIWNTLTGGQYSFFTVASSDTFANVPFPGIQWQGPVDGGSTRALPGIQWQGPVGRAQSRAAGPDGPADEPASYVLSLLPPGGTTLIDSAYAANHPGLGIEFFSGPTFQYYSITAPAPGIWTLYVYERSPSADTGPVLVSIASITDLVMVSSIERLSYAPGETVPMAVVVANGGVAGGGPHIIGGGPVTDAVVRALVTPPGGGNPSEVILTHGVNGTYTGSYSGTDAPGTYDIVFTARRDSIRRTAIRSFYVVPEFNGRAVILGNRSVSLEAGASVTSGDIIVNTSRQDRVHELVVGPRATTPAGYVVRASDILVRSGALIGGDVTYNTLQNNGTVAGALSTPLHLPVFSTLPAFRQALPGTAPVRVRGRALVTLGPGAYGELTVDPAGTLILSGGVYHFTDITVKAQGKILAAAATEIRVYEGLDADSRSYVGPAPGSLLGARDIILYVTGTDGARRGRPRAVTAGPNAAVYANIYAPLGSITFGAGATASGAFIADQVEAGPNSRISLASAFAPGSGAALQPWAIAPDEDLSDRQIPYTFALEQNYPNPFNPSTTIRYELAEPRPVTLQVYDVLGRLVRTLVDEQLPSGSHLVTWDGRNNQGLPVGSGAFFYRLNAGDFTMVRSMMLLK